MQSKIDIPFIIQQMHDTGYMFWRMRDPAGHVVGVYNELTPDITVSTARLKSLAECYPGLPITIDLLAKGSKTGTGNADITHTITMPAAPGQNTNAIAGVPAAIPPGYMPVEQHNMILEFTKQIADLNARINNAQATDPSEKWIGLLDRYAPLLINNGNAPMANTTPPINGPMNEAEIEEANDRLSAAMEQLLLSDPNAVEMIEAMAYFATQKPEMYKMQSGMLLNAYKSERNG